MPILFFLMSTVACRDKANIEPHLFKPRTSFYLGGGVWGYCNLEPDDKLLSSFSEARDVTFSSTIFDTTYFKGTKIIFFVTVFKLYACKVSLWLFTPLNIERPQISTRID